MCIYEMFLNELEAGRMVEHPEGTKANRFKDIVCKIYI